MKIHLLLTICGLATLSNCIAFIDSFSDSQKHKDTFRKNLGLLSAGVSMGNALAGPEGTVFTSTDGKLQIMIPPGAMKDTQQFKITRYTPTSQILPSGYIPTSAVYEITPSYRFNTDISISLVVDSSQIHSLNLVSTKTSGFSASLTPPDESTGRFPDWGSHDSRVESDRVHFTTRTFSYFGAGTPPVGNLPPDIRGAYYYFKPNCSYVPYQVRTQIIEPDGDNMTVNLIIGKVGGGTNYIPMTREGMTQWYVASIPYEAMGNTGVQMQVSATDQWGATTSRPSTSIFQYPTDSGDSTYINNYDIDQDNDGYNDVWEVDHGYNPRNASNPTGIVDSDSDGIPNISDATPNGESNPPIDSLNIFPLTVTADITENIVFGVSASYLGQPRFVNPTFVSTGNGLSGQPVGNLSGGMFTAVRPGVAGVIATVGALNATASVTVNDTVGPNAIADLSASPRSHTRIRLQWSAPGNDGSFGRAAAYEIKRSTSSITNDGTCNTATPVAHTLVPKPVGLLETLEIDGLSPATTYYFCIRAYDLKGNRNIWTGSVNASTYSVPDLTPPASISTATANALDGSTIQLNWTAVGGDGMTGSASAYEIRKSTSSIGSDLECDAAIFVPNTVGIISAGSPVGFSVTGLTPNTVYHFCIRAYDSSGNRSIWSNLLTATTPYVNSPPIANAGTDSIVEPGDTAYLDGTASSNPDATLCGVSSGNYLFKWTFVRKPPTSALTNTNIIGASTLSASFVPDVAGIYEIALTFTDSPGSCAGTARSSTDSAIVDARPAGWFGFFGPANNMLIPRNNLTTPDGGMITFSTSYADVPTFDGKTPRIGFGSYGLATMVVKFNSKGRVDWYTFIPGADAASFPARLADGSYIFSSWASTAVPSINGTFPIVPFNNGAQDAMVVKLSPNGILQWYTFVGGTDSDYPPYGTRTLEVTADGGIAFIIASRSTSLISGTVPLMAHSGLPEYNLLIAKLTANGILQWTTFLRSLSTGELSARNDGTILFSATVGAVQPTNINGIFPKLTYSGGTDSVVGSLDSTGSLQWWTYLGGTGADNLRMLPMSDGGITMYGNSLSSVESLGGVLPWISAKGNYDPLVIRLNATGDVQWFTFLGSAGSDRGYGIVETPSGGLVLVGSVGGALSGLEGKNPIRGYTSGDDGAIWMLKPDGHLDWYTQIGAAGIDYLSDVQRLSTGNYLVTGNTQVSIPSLGTVTPINPYSGQQDTTLFMMDAAGSISWYTHLGPGVSGGGFVHTSPTPQEGSDGTLYGLLQATRGRSLLMGKTPLYLFPSGSTFSGMILRLNPDGSF
ncbi:fibronectin type III domain-containing protein [Leptospira perdikensis]|uniref:Fibronectin type-III domain-containing protein n=1 Tax=Leptospira perdikensis TaxID=2484948 RepID=A0A4R9JKQ9_9LEPT|nr:fibronectin type III domain-containing protein [Leptospira perdikensis]TGL45612.1 hypothetical protein EHQ49_01025 [Leptospira perdikensis]